MNPDQTAPRGAVWSGFILFASMKKSNLKYTWLYAAGMLAINYAQMTCSICHYKVFSETNIRSAHSNVCQKKKK